MEHAEQSKDNTSRLLLPISSDGGGTQRQVSSNGVKMIGRVYKSQQNGGVFDPNGIAPCLCVGHHSGVEPKIIVYE